MVAAQTSVLEGAELASLQRHETGHVRFGSNAAFGWIWHVRCAPNNDRIADVRKQSKRATSRNHKK